MTIFAASISNVVKFATIVAKKHWSRHTIHASHSRFKSIHASRIHAIPEETEDTMTATERQNPRRRQLGTETIVTEVTSIEPAQQLEARQLIRAGS